MHLPRSFLMNFIASEISVTYWIPKLIAQSLSLSLSLSNFLLQWNFPFSLLAYNIHMPPKTSSSPAYNSCGVSLSIEKHCILLSALSNCLVEIYSKAAALLPIGVPFYWLDLLQFDLNLLCDINKFHSWLNCRDYLINLSCCVHNTATSTTTTITTAAAASVVML